MGEKGGSNKKKKRRSERGKHGEKEKKRKGGGRREMGKISGLTGEIHIPEIVGYTRV